MMPGRYKLKRERYAALRHDFLQNGAGKIAVENLRTLKAALGITLVVLTGLLIASLTVEPWRNGTLVLGGGLSLYAGLSFAAYLFETRLLHRKVVLDAFCSLFLFSVLMLIAYLSAAGTGQTAGLLYAPLAIALAIAFVLPPWINAAAVAASSVWLVWMTSLFKSADVVRTNALIAAVALVLAAPLAWRQFLTRLQDYSRIRELERLTCTDCLTGLLNKGAAETAADNYLRRFGAQEGATFILIDLDHFKRVNEELGHPVGDETLEVFGEKLLTLFRRQDIVGRVGGDEFAVVMKGVSDRELVARRAEEICKMARDVSPTGLESELTCSVGAAFCPEHGANFHRLYVTADAELFMLKGDREGGYRIAS